MSRKVFISLVTISVTQPGHITFAAPNCKQLWLCCLFADADAFAAAGGAARIDNYSTGILCSPCS